MHCRAVGRLVALCGAVAAVVSATLVLVLPAEGAAPGRPFATSIYPADLTVASATLLDRIRTAGATMIRLDLAWSQVAPTHQPASWHPADPGDPNYRWGSIDDEVSLSVKHGLTPYITVTSAPTWAQKGSPKLPAWEGTTSARPDPHRLALFATALARRYSGSFRQLPRVRYFQLWNEENLARNLWPQLLKGQPVAPRLYRGMLNAFYTAVHRVHADNVVVAGGLDPFRDIDPAVQRQDKDWGPLSFMRNLLCLSKTGAKTCSAKVSFDVFAVHPYTSGGPTHKAVLPNDVSLGNLPEVKRLLDAARRHGTIRSRGDTGLWVTEFSWDSNPPDPKAVPMRLLMQWIPEAFYRMWASGVSNVTWFLLRDQSTGYFQSGLYEAGKTIARDRAKPILHVFRFPLVALPRGGGKWYLWGRTPAGKRATVDLIHISFGRRTKIATLKTDRYGIFQGTFDIGLLGYVQAQIAGTSTKSAAYKMQKNPDRPVDPFGGALG